jgi:hypothetical protein
MARRFSPATLALIGLCLLGVLAGFVREFSGDFHYHVVLGQKTLATHHPYRIDDLSHTMAGKPMFISAWLGDVLLAIAWGAGGYVGIYLLRALCLVAMLLLLAREMEKLGLSLASSCALLVLLLAQSFFVFYARPETMAFAVFAAVLYLLGQTSRDWKPKRLIGVVALLALWSNLHGSSVIGLVAVGLWSVEYAVREKKWAVLGLPVAAALATCLNPETYRAALAFQVMRPTYLAHTTEWLPMHWSQLPPILAVALGAVIVTTVGAGKKTSPWRVVLVLILTVLSAKYRRFATFALIAAAPLLAVNLVALRDRLQAGERAHFWKRLGLALGIGCALWGLVTLIAVRNLFGEIGTGVDPRAYPEAACEWVKAHPPKGKMLNEFDFGSYLMFCQSQPVFIDQRSWSLYPESFYAEYLHAPDSLANFAGLIDKYKIGWAFLGYDPLARRMSAHPQFKMVYFDDRAMVYARKNDALMDLSTLDPTRLSWLLDAKDSSITLARSQLEEQDRRCPTCYRTELARLAIASAAGDEATYDATWTRISKGHPTWEAAYIAGRHAMKNGKYDEAATYFSSMPSLGGEPRLAKVLEAAARKKAASPPSPINAPTDAGQE